MCTRKQAIATVVSLKKGTIQELKDHIGDEFYRSFVVLGYINERLKVTGPVKTGHRIEWEATERATRKNDFYNLLAENL